MLHSALRDFPIIGDQIGENIHSLQGSTFGLVVGIVGSLYGALAVGVAAQNAMNKIWAVPRAERPRCPASTAAARPFSAFSRSASRPPPRWPRCPPRPAAWASGPVDAALRVGAVACRCWSTPVS